jgi:hypothetical protein
VTKHKDHDGESASTRTWKRGETKDGVKKNTEREREREREGAETIFRATSKREESE